MLFVLHVGYGGNVGSEDQVARLGSLSDWKVRGVVHEPTTNSVASATMTSRMDDLEAIALGNLVSDVFICVHLFL